MQGCAGLALCASVAVNIGGATAPLCQVHLTHVPGSGMQEVWVTPRVPRRLRGNRHRAFIVGVNRYPAPHTLTQCVDDAVEMHRVFTSKGYAVNLVRDPTKEELRQAFQHFVRSLFPGCVGVLYFSGHGCTVAACNYLIPVDGDLTSGAEAQCMCPCMFSVCGFGGGVSVGGSLCVHTPLQHAA